MNQRYLESVDMHLRILKLSLLCLAAFATSGCWVHYHYRHGPPAVVFDATYVRWAPPPPRHVRIPPRPAPAAVWLGGYWRWTGVDYVWVDGFWERNPPYAKVWTPGRWIHTSRGWYWRPGHWR